MIGMGLIGGQSWVAQTVSYLLKPDDQKVGVIELCRATG